MAHKMDKEPEGMQDINKYPSPLNQKTECVAFVQAVTDVGGTKTWTKGERIWGSKAGIVEKWSAIATFDENGKYPTDAKGKHAAIYVSHDDDGINVLDQWASQKQVLPRKISFNVKSDTTRSNDGKTFYVIK